MKWLWIVWPAGLKSLSRSATLAKGTLPTTRWNEPRGARVAAKDSARICASGYRYAATAAVIGSSSTPTICAPGGAAAMKLPDPQPGSRTGPSVNPSRCTASQIGWTRLRSV